MFNLGYKDLILNMVSPETIYAADRGGREVVVIPGYATFYRDQILTHYEQSSEQKVSEVASWVIPGLDCDYFIVEIVLKKRNVDRTKTVTFTSTSNDLAGVLAGYTKYLEAYNIRNPLVTLHDVGGQLQTVIGAWDPEVYTSGIFITKKQAITLKWIDTSSSQKESRFFKFSLGKTVLLEGNSGHLYGHQLEESKRFGTVYNVDPYVEYAGDNSKGIILNARYYAFSLAYKDTVEWGHEFIKSAGVNLASPKQKYYFTMYVLDVGSNVSDFGDILFPSIVPGDIFDDEFDEPFN